MAKSKAKKQVKVNYWKTWKFLWRFAGPVYKPVWWVLIFLFVSIAIGLVEPNVYRLVIDAITVSGGIDIVYVGKLLAFWGGVSLLNILVSGIYAMVLKTRHESISLRFLPAVFCYMLYKDLEIHLSDKKGELVKKLDRASDAFYQIISALIDDILKPWVMTIAVLVMSFYINWPMTLVMLTMVPLYVVVFGFGFMSTARGQKNVNQYYTALWGDVSDKMTNIMVVKSFGQERDHLSSWGRALQKLVSKQILVSKRWAIIDSGGEVLGIINRVIIFAGGIYLMHLQVVTLGVLIMFLSLSGYIYGPLERLGGRLRNFQYYFLHLQEAMEEMEKVNLVQDSVGAKDLRVQSGLVEMKKVSFHYEKLGILKDVSIRMEPGTMTALVGHSGAGKSTVVSLLVRFYDVKKGAVLIDGQDIREVTQKSLRENIGIVMQENSMFNDTIYNNIRYAKSRASRAEVIAAARAANIHNFIMSQPKGYQTVVGERGLKLSGGQKQRVAIARVILKNPPILILDEATSALDSASEKVVQEALEHVMKGRTSIVIAHRLSTVRKADQIVVLDKGLVRQQGTHSELMLQDGIYKDLVDLQVNGLLAK